MLAPAPAAAPSGADPELGIRRGQKWSEASIRKHRGPQAELTVQSPTGQILSTTSESTYHFNVIRVITFAVKIITILMQRTHLSWDPTDEGVIQMGVESGKDSDAIAVNRG